MVVSRFKGLQRKRGYFNLEGDTERQMQDFEQDTDDSLRALSDQIDRVRTEAVESKEETQAEVTRVSEETAGQNTQIGELDDRVTALENPPDAPYGYARGIASSVVADTNRLPFDTPTLRGGMTVASDAWVIPEDGVYQISAIGAWRTGNTANPSNVVIRFRRNGSSTLADTLTRRWNTNTGNVVGIDASIARYLVEGDTIFFENRSGNTLTQSTTASQTVYTIVKVGE